MSETMAKAVCSQLTQDLVKTVPQIDDYLCPVCFTIAWRPVRMKCHHILCISCAVTLQKKRERFCPLCRGDVILAADAGKHDLLSTNHLHHNLLVQHTNWVQIISIPHSRSSLRSTFPKRPARSGWRWRPKGAGSSLARVTNIPRNRNVR